mmetsp:Transcript_26181/g.35710  ORF Transcript_26181/g.35710 Transcript_26181/m.35710 type:complete len:392 (-) Transcript_26181:43-1218(-)
MEVHTDLALSLRLERHHLRPRAGQHGCWRLPDLKGRCLAVVEQEDAGAGSNGNSTTIDEVPQGHDDDQGEPHQEVLSQADLGATVYEPVQHDLDAEQDHDAANEEARHELEDVDRQQEKQEFASTDNGARHLAAHLLPLREDCHGEDVAACVSTTQATDQVGDANHAHLRVRVQGLGLLHLDGRDVQHTAEGNHQEQQEDVHDLRWEHVPGNSVEAVVELEALPARGGMLLWVRDPVAGAGTRKRDASNQQAKVKDDGCGQEHSWEGRRVLDLLRDEEQHQRKGDAERQLAPKHSIEDEELGPSLDAIDGQASAERGTGSQAEVADVAQVAADHRQWQQLHIARQPQLAHNKDPNARECGRPCARHEHSRQGLMGCAPCCDGRVEHLTRDL